MIDKMSNNDDKYILNQKTGRKVLKTGKIGRKLLQELNSGTSGSIISVPSVVNFEDGEEEINDTEVAPIVSKLSKLSIKVPLTKDNEQVVSKFARLSIDQSTGWTGTIKGIPYNNEQEYQELMNRPDVQKALESFRKQTEYLYIYSAGYNYYTYDYGRLK